MLNIIVITPKSPHSPPSLLHLALKGKDKIAKKNLDTGHPAISLQSSQLYKILYIPRHLPGAHEKSIPLSAALLIVGGRVWRSQTKNCKTTKEKKKNCPQLSKPA